MSEQGKPRRGSRLAIPAEGTTVCASCRTPRGNQRKGWLPVTRGDEVVAFTCPDCPRFDEPIRRVTTKAGRVRFRYVVDAKQRGSSGPRKQVSGTADSLPSARAKVAEVRAQVAAAGRYQAPTSESVEALLDRWLATRIDVRPVTIESNQASIATLVRKIGAEDVTKLVASDIRKLVADLQKAGGRPRKDGSPRPLGADAVRKAISVLARALDLAIADKMIAENPAKGVTLPALKKKKGTDLPHWDTAQMLKFREQADTDAWAAGWRLSFCGLRRSEVLGLRWVDVNFDKATVSINQGRVQLGRQRTHVDEPKSDASWRTVPVDSLAPGTMDMLVKLSVDQLEARERAGDAWTETGLVLVDELGVGIRPERYSDRFRVIAKSARLPSIVLHALRHSLAFRLHHRNIAPADAAALLGHSVKVHLDTYLRGQAAPVSRWRRLLWAPRRSSWRRSSHNPKRESDGVQTADSHRL